jgi:hypothetical protein
MRFPMMLILALPLLASPGAAEAPLVRERLGDLTYDAAIYAVAGKGGSYFVRVRDQDDAQPMTVTIHDGPASDCTIAKLEADARTRRGDHSDLKARTITRDGFDIHVVRWYWGCRNARPPSVMACTAFRGRVYRFLALSIGCKGGPGFSAGLEGFLGSLAAVP